MIWFWIVLSFIFGLFCGVGMDVKFNEQKNTLEKQLELAKLESQIRFCHKNNFFCNRR